MIYKPTVTAAEIITYDIPTVTAAEIITYDIPSKK